MAGHFFLSALTYFFGYGFFFIGVSALFVIVRCIFIGTLSVIFGGKSETMESVPFLRRVAGHCLLPFPVEKNGEFRGFGRMQIFSA